MQIDISWFDEAQHALLWQMPATFDADDLKQALETSKTLIKSQHPRRIDVVVDLSYLRYYPTTVVTVLKTYKPQAPKNLGIVVLFGANRIINTMTRIIIKMPFTNDSFYLVAAEDDARQIITTRINRRQRKRPPDDT